MDNFWSFLRVELENWNVDPKSIRTSKWTTELALLCMANQSIWVFQQCSDVRRCHSEVFQVLRRSNSKEFSKVFQRSNFQRTKFLKVFEDLFWFKEPKERKTNNQIIFHFYFESVPSKTTFNLILLQDRLLYFLLVHLGSLQENTHFEVFWGDRVSHMPAKLKILSSGAELHSWLFECMNTFFTAGYESSCSSDVRVSVYHSRTYSLIWWFNCCLVVGWNCSRSLFVFKNLKNSLRNENL